MKTWKQWSESEDSDDAPKRSSEPSIKAASGDLKRDEAEKDLARIKAEIEREKEDKAILGGKYRRPLTPPQQKLFTSTGQFEFKTKIPDPSLKRGQAILKAKEAFWDTERAPKLFDNKTIRLDKIDTEQVPDGWEVSILFTGTLATVPDLPEDQELQQRYGRVAERDVTPEEIASAGFTRIQKSIPLPGPRLWKFTYHIPHIDMGFKYDIRTLSQEQIKQVEAHAMHKAGQVYKGRYPGLFENVETDSVEAYSTPEEWVVSITFIGDAKGEWTSDLEESLKGQGFFSAED